MTSNILTHTHPKYPSHSNKNITTLDLDEIISRINKKEELEVCLQSNYSNEVSKGPRYKHDSIPYLLDLAYGITQISKGKSYTTSDRVRSITSLDIIGLKADINDFLARNKEINYRGALNRIGKILETILQIKNDGDIVNWNIIFSRLEKAA